MLTEHQRNMINELRDCGCAVTVFQPEEMKGVDPELIEEGLIVEGNTIIEKLSQE